MSEQYQRHDGRAYDELRPISMTPNYIIHPEGSVLIATGQTKVLCNVSVEAGVPRWMSAGGKPGGWLTAEYAMLPRSTHSRTRRETLRPRGRTQEISRLIGRSLRAAVNLEALGEFTYTVDCGVLQADGGTRTAAVTGSYTALAIALKKQIAAGVIAEDVFAPAVAAVSVGIVAGTSLLDLDYVEDSTADADINVVMTAEGKLIEIQGTAEGAPFSREDLDHLLDLAGQGIQTLLDEQQACLDKIRTSK